MLTAAYLMTDMGTSPIVGGSACWAHFRNQEPKPPG